MVRSVTGAEPFASVTAWPGREVRETVAVPGTSAFVSLPYVSKDDGRTWPERTVPPGGSTVGDWRPFVLPATATAPPVLVVAVGGTLWRSTDLARSWQPLRSLPVDESGPTPYTTPTRSAVYVNTSLRGLSRGSLEGGYLQPIPALADVAFPLVLAVPTHPRLAVALARGPQDQGALWVSRDAGESSQRRAIPLPSTCRRGEVALTPHGRLVVLLYGEHPAQCRTASLLSPPLDRP